MCLHFILYNLHRPHIDSSNHQSFIVHYYKWDFHLYVACGICYKDRILLKWVAVWSWPASRSKNHLLSGHKLYKCIKSCRSLLYLILKLVRGYHLLSVTSIVCVYLYIVDCNQIGRPIGTYLSHQVKTQYLHFKIHPNYSLLPLKIAEEISRRSMLFHC